MKPNDLLNRLAAGYDYDPMYGELCNERDALQAENAKLREQLDTAEHNQTRNAREYARMCHENDRLRELVRDMVLNMGGCALHGNALRLREFGNRAKELGVEV
ncbi:MAG: hypothetical protein J6D54_13605 [Olsenella sp.]|nr:hypothetical protein [Olsenella sp.]